MLLLLLIVLSYVCLLACLLAVLVLFVGLLKLIFLFPQQQSCSSDAIGGVEFIVREQQQVVVVYGTFLHCMLVMLVHFSINFGSYFHTRIYGIFTFIHSCLLLKIMTLFPSEKYNCSPFHTPPYIHTPLHTHSP